MIRKERSGELARRGGDPRDDQHEAGGDAGEEAATRTEGAEEAAEAAAAAVQPARMLLQPALREAFPILGLSRTCIYACRKLPLSPVTFIVRAAERLTRATARHSNTHEAPEWMSEAAPDY